ncbi:MAG: hypothetical protein AAFW76_00735 [Pseudomonadota bacterium]
MIQPSAEKHAVAKGWIDLFAELDRWQRENRTARFWWRDDDAQRVTTPLAQLVELSGLHGIPLLLAVIPEGSEPDLASHIAASGAPVTVAQHGIAHRNNAPEGEKKTELHDRMLDNPEFVGALKDGRHHLADLFGPAFLPVMVPPWNRIGPGIAGKLGGWDYAGLSVDGPPRPEAGTLAQVNTHLDLIDWRADKAFIGPDRALTALIDHLAHRRETPADGSAIGLLTHHLDHGRPLWAFLSQLFGLLGGHPAVQWADPSDLFAPA